MTPRAGVAGARCKGRSPELAREISAAAKELIARFWPGALTLYLKPHPALTWDLGDEQLLDQVAVRVPLHEFAIKLLNETGPLAVAGASLSGRKQFSEALLVNEVFGSNLELIFDGGEVEVGSVSAVVDCTCEPPRVIRLGAIDSASLREACPAISLELG